MDCQYSDKFVSVEFGAHIRDVLIELGYSEEDIRRTVYVFQNLMPAMLELFTGVMIGIIKSGPYISPIALQLLGDKLKEVSDATVAYREQLLEGKTPQELLAEFYNQSYAPPPDELGGTSIEQWIDDNLDLSDI